MTTMTYENISFSGFAFRGMFYGSFSCFNAEFQFGKSYLLRPRFKADAWAVSWIVAGALKHQGRIFKDGAEYTARQRFRDDWRVQDSHNDIKLFGLIDRTVQGYVRYAQKHSRLERVPSEEEIREVFKLTTARYTRPMHHLSGEAWRASCAVGYVLGRKIFCFRPMMQATIEQYDEVWFAEMLSFLTQSGILVIMPIENSYPVRSGFCDLDLELSSLLKHTDLIY
jgi:hypothetical protein